MFIDYSQDVRFLVDHCVHCVDHLYSSHSQFLQNNTAFINRSQWHLHDIGDAFPHDVLLVFDDSHLARNSAGGCRRAKANRKTKSHVELRSRP